MYSVRVSCTRDISSHRFHYYIRAKLAWAYTATIIFRLKYPSYLKGKMKRIDIMQRQFNKKLLEAHMAFKRNW